MIGRTSLDARYFDDIFAEDDDPWDLATSAYEAEKFARTHAAIADRRYQAALEIGCAHGVLTEKILPCCDSLLAIDISSKALAKAHKRVGDRPGLKLQHPGWVSSHRRVRPGLCRLWRGGHRLRLLRRSLGHPLAVRGRRPCLPSAP
jgi:SAM-dependent methyltransferase